MNVIGSEMFIEFFDRLSFTVGKCGCMLYAYTVSVLSYTG